MGCCTIQIWAKFKEQQKKAMKDKSMKKEENHKDLVLMNLDNKLFHREWVTSSKFSEKMGKKSITESSKTKYLNSVCGVQWKKVQIGVSQERDKGELTINIANTIGEFCCKAQ